MSTGTDRPTIEPKADDGAAAPGLPETPADLTKPSRVVRALKAVYKELVANQRQEVTFWVLLTFLPTFIATRALVYFAPQLFVNLGGTHVHHLTWGIILLALTGWLALLIEAPRWRPRIAALYGVGLALAFDEFGMWLHLQDDYWVRQSYDAVLVVLAVLVNTVYFGDFWLRVVRRLLRRRSRPFPPEDPSL
jgi:hypothetical protein